MSISRSPRDSRAQLVLDPRSPESESFLPITLSPGFITVMVMSAYPSRDILKMREARELEGWEAEGKSLGPSETSFTMQTEAVWTVEPGRAF